MKPVRFACLVVSLCLLSVEAAPPSSGRNEDIVMVEDIVSVGPGENADTNVALITLSQSQSQSQSSEEDSDSSSKEHNVSDDLIFLTHKSQTQTQIQSQSQIQTQLREHVDDSQESAEEHDGAVDVDVVQQKEKQVKPIDMSPFVALIPTEQVQAIASNYYRQDAEVKRAYGYLSTSSQTQKMQQLTRLPEMEAFTRYLNASGLDVFKLGKAIWQAIAPAAGVELPQPVKDASSTCTELSAGNAEEHTSKEQMRGLQGFVDSILEALPQDQILATFFDKVEADQQFSKLIDSIGSPKFSRILSNLQNSVPLRAQLFELHKCGINIGQIVECLKSYFFLSSF